MQNHIIHGVRRRMGYTNGCDIPPAGAAGGLSLWWGDNVEVKVMVANRNLIHTKMRLSSEEWFQASWIYSSGLRRR
ncbi:hypothetical protein ACFX2G_047708 [Malus domestica]